MKRLEIEGDKDADQSNAMGRVEKEAIEAVEKEVSNEHKGAANRSSILEA